MVTKVRLTSYKSIPTSSVVLGALTFLVGRNGAGKSNFIDALEFIHDAVDTNLDAAIRAHGSPGSIRRVGSTEVGISVSVGVPGREVSYSLSLVMPDNSYEVMAEELRAPSSEPLTLALPGAHLRVLSLPAGAVASEDAKTMYDFLRSMRFYDFSLPAMRELQDPSEGTLLRSDGANLAGVVGRLESTDSSRYERLHEYMSAILPGLKRVKSELLGPKEALRFEMNTGQFYAQHMSTGTLLALAVLTTLFQTADQSGQPPTLVALEEPERALHPAAVSVLLDAMVEASADRQVIVTTQSPDLLDRKDVAADNIRAVVSSDAGTAIGPLGENARRVMAEHLFTAGELVKLDQLAPNE